MMGVVLFVGSALVLALMAIHQLNRGRASAIVFAALSGYSMLAVATAQSLHADFGPAAYVHGSAIFFVGSLLLTLSVGLIAGLFPSPRVRVQNWSHNDLARHAHTGIGFAVVGLLLIVSTRADLLETWSDARSDAGPLTTLGTFLLLLAGTSIVSAALTRRHATTVTLLIVCVGGFVISGSRATLLGPVVFGLWVLLLRARSGWKKLWIVTLAALVGFAAHVLLRQVRGLGIGGLLEAYQQGSLLSTLTEIPGDGDLSGGEAAIPRYFLFATETSSTAVYGFMTSILRLVLVAVPRVEQWYEKPIDVTYRLWEEGFVSGLFSEAEGQGALLDSFITGSLGSLHGTLFGEYYSTGGWPSLLLSVVILATVLVGIEAILARARPTTAIALTGPTLVGYLFVARGNSVIGLGYFFYLGVIYVLLRPFFDWATWRRWLSGDRRHASAQSP